MPIRRSFDTSEGKEAALESIPADRKCENESKDVDKALNNISKWGNVNEK